MPGRPTGELAALGEAGLVAALRERLPQGEGVHVGPGDDAAVVDAPDGRVVATTDLLVEGVHFRRDWSAAIDVGRKAAAQNLADVIAMGARPTALLVGFAAPRELPVDWALGLAEGLQLECEPLGVSVVGGDVVAAPVVMVAVSALGDLAGREPVLRSGARVGDVVAVAGRLGWSAAGHAVLSRGFRSPRTLVEAHRRPEPPYADGLAAAEAGAHAMCDVSDGLLVDLGRVAAASEVGIDLRLEALEPDDALHDASAALGTDPHEWVLGGGEDHAFVAAFAADVALPEGFRPIGSVVEGHGVTVDGSPWPGPTGFEHFR